MRTTRCKNTAVVGTCGATNLVVNLARGYGCIAEVFRVAVRGVEAAGGGDATGSVVHAAEPAGVVVDAAAAQLESRREVNEKEKAVTAEIQREDKNDSLSLNKYWLTFFLCVLTSNNCF